MKRRLTGSNTYVGMGAVSLSVILVVLTIASFALLTYISANSDCKLSQKAAENVTEYYAAETAANRTLKQISADIGSPGWENKMTAMGCDVSYTSQGCLISFSQPINTHKTLDITVLATDFSGFTVLKWQTVIDKQ